MSNVSLMLIILYINKDTISQHFCYVVKCHVHILTNVTSASYLQDADEIGVTLPQVNFLEYAHASKNYNIPFCVVQNLG